MATSPRSYIAKVRRCIRVEAAAYKAFKRVLNSELRKGTKAAKSHEAAADAYTKHMKKASCASVLRGR